MVGSALAHPVVNYVATRPGPFGIPADFAGEFVISFLLFLTVLIMSNSHRHAGWTGIVVGALIAIYISIEEPLSGMSMNPARTFGSALRASLWEGMWIYFVAPPLAMFAASRLYLRFRRRTEAPACPKMHHDNNRRCIFCGRPGGTRLPMEPDGAEPRYHP
jgi:aquaporin Z